MRNFEMSVDDLTRYYSASLTNWMRMAGYSASETARLLDITPSMLSQIMCGVKRPSLELLARTVCVTGMTPNDVFATPEFATTADNPMEALRAMSETHAKLGAQIKLLYEKMREA